MGGFKEKKIFVELDENNPNLEQMKNNLEAAEEMQEEIALQKTSEKKKELTEKKQEELKKVQKNVDKMKSDLAHGRTKSQVNEKNKDKVYGGEKIVDPKDVEREYMKDHFKNKNVKMKTPTKRVQK